MSQKCVDCDCANCDKNEAYDGWKYENDDDRCVIVWYTN